MRTGTAPKKRKSRACPSQKLSVHFRSKTCTKQGHSHRVLPTLSRAYPKSTCASSGAVAQGNDDLLLERLDLRHQLFHRGVTDLMPTLDPDPVENRLALFPRHQPVRVEDAAYHSALTSLLRQRLALCCYLRTVLREIEEFFWHLYGRIE
jgi:hypothetical protein